MLIYLLGASIALNLLLLYLWRVDRFRLSVLHYHFVHKAGMTREEFADEMQEDYEEFCDGCSIWDKLFG